MDDIALLQEYATRRSEAAFDALVSRHVSFVYSSALRQVRNPHLAEEVTQAVFIILAQKAGRIREKTILTGWLFKTARFAALAQTRAHAKRKQREHEAHMQTEIEQIAPDPLWQQMSPLLDDALGSLAETDRQALLLRFFENKSLAEVGNSLSTTEDTARKRITRALEKLRKFFSGRGVVSTTALIAGALSANSVHAAPAALATTITATAVKGSAVAASTLTLVKGTLSIMTWIKTKIAIAIAASTLLVAGAGFIAAQEQKIRLTEEQIRAEENRVRAREQEIRTEQQKTNLSVADKKQLEEQLTKLRARRDELRTEQLRLHGSHASSPESLARLVEILRREGGHRPVEKARQERIKAKLTGNR